VQPYHLLHKTELRIEHISLRDANLTDLAAVVADTLSLEREKVLVIDVRDNTVALDILQESVDATAIVGKQDLLLRRLAALPGVGVTQETAFSSDGMLGWIAWDEAEGRHALRRSEEIAAEIHRKLSRQVIVFSTGAEVVTGQIEDTNTPAIARRLEAEGYSVTPGPALGDDVDLIFGYLRIAVEDDGYGLVITTGGTGAEDKDCTIEAVQALDPDAATPYICKYEQGVGRHLKDGVRIAVGQLGDATIIALPGPNDEVKAGLEVLVQGLKAGLSKSHLAEHLAERLRTILRQKTTQRAHALQPRPGGVSP
jgi:molybdenum cofactor synthesis domain-containing protein